MAYTHKRIPDPPLNSVVHHTGFGKEGDKNYPCDVLITNGCYLDSLYGRLCNFWHWRRILPDGKISKVDEYGYGSFTRSLHFTTAKNKVKIEIKKTKRMVKA